MEESLLEALRRVGALTDEQHTEALELVRESADFDSLEMVHGVAIAS